VGGAHTRCTGAKSAFVYNIDPTSAAQPHPLWHYDFYKLESPPPQEASM
jgi:hypothetical protein